nr:ergothioneine biosynthesis protein 1 [Quercus suber]
MGSTDAVVRTASGHDIIDIRSDAAGFELKQEIFAGLKEKNGKPRAEKTLPTLLLYDDAGLKLFERITYLEQYYLTRAEIEVLEKHAESIAQRIPNNAMLVELGSGNLRKVNILLQALERARKHVDYFALDLMKSELDRTLSDVPDYQYVKVAGLWGTYDDGLAFLKTPQNAIKPKVILSIGSSIGNFTREDAVGFVRQFASILGPDDALLIGIDACQDADRVYNAYNDQDGITHEFTMNGLRHANNLLGYEAFRDGEWEAIGEYDEEGGRHRAFVVPTKDLTLGDVPMRKGEKVRIEESYKYNQAQSDALWTAAGVTPGTAWSNDGNHG